MESKEQQKRVTTLSTVSLDSLSDQSDGPAELKKQIIWKRWTWTPSVAMTALILSTFGLVLILDHDAAGQQEIDDAKDRNSTATSFLTSDEGLNGPEKQLMEWVNQARNASELYVAGGSTNVSVTGVLFPRKDTASMFPFDAMMALNFEGVFPSRQYVALRDGRAFKWTMTSLNDEDIITTSGCLTANQSLSALELDAIVPTANWTCSLRYPKSKVNVVVDGATYTVAKEKRDFVVSMTMDDEQCWLIESKDEEVQVRVCMSMTDEELPRTDFQDLFNATAHCLPLAQNAVRVQTRTTLSVPLPLRKWYASYEAQ